MTDIQIAQQAAPLPIGDIAAACGIDPQYLEQYGRYKACCGTGRTGPTAS